MRRFFINLYLALALSLYLAGLAGALLATPAAMLLSALAFLTTFLLAVIRHGSKRQPIRLKWYWTIAAPTFAVLLLATILLSLDRGSPANDKLPVLAERKVYRFTRAPEVERWRFVTVGVSFLFAWHLLGIGFAAEQWASMRERAK